MPAITDWNDVVAIAFVLFLTVSSIALALSIIGAFFSSDDNENENGKTN